MSSTSSGLSATMLAKVDQPDVAIDSFGESIHSRASSGPNRDSVATHATVYSLTIPHDAFFTHFWNWVLVICGGGRIGAPRERGAPVAAGGNSSALARDFLPRVLRC